MGAEVELRRPTCTAGDVVGADSVSDVSPVPSRGPALEGQDSLVLALARLVRDRWEAEQAHGATPLALPARPSNMPTMDEETQPGRGRSA